MALATKQIHDREKIMLKVFKVSVNSYVTFKGSTDEDYDDRHVFNVLADTAEDAIAKVKKELIGTKVKLGSKDEGDGVVHHGKITSVKLNEIVELTTVSLT